LSFYGYDGHGSVRFLTDAAGTITDTWDYDAFGNLISRTGATSNDYLYTGEQLDPNLGFYYLRARYMNPQSGRFATMDAYEGGAYDPGSLHKYTYAENRPSELVDPSGHFGIGSITGEINALTWRVTIKTWEFQRALVAGRLIVAALNFASFFGDNESRDIFITLSGGPLNAGIALTRSASVLFGVTRSALSAGFATGGGLSRSAIISEQTANRLLMNKVGLTLEESSSFTASFDGPVTATIAEPGDQWFRYTGVAGSRGSFLTKVSFAQPTQAIDALNLRPWGNPANIRQTVTATGRSIILEGSIKGGVPPGVRQTVIVDREKFQFSVGEKY
jgi:RHS repeat-associated protein